jgi:AcrR family transcriptional regulator
MSGTIYGRPREKCWIKFEGDAMLEPASPGVARPITGYKDAGGRVKARRRGRPRSEESEEAILASTVQLLSEKPLRDISMEEIARRAGVGKATIYKWWPSRAYVALDAFLKKTNQMVPTPDTGSVRKDMREQIRSLVAFYKSPAGQIMGQFIAETQIDKEFASLFRERYIKPRREAAGVIFDRGVERGEIDQNLDWGLVRDLVFGAFLYRMIVGHAPFEDKLVDNMVSILFDGLDRRCAGRGGMRRKASGRNGGSRGKGRQRQIQQNS